MTDYIGCPYCKAENKVEMYENYEDACDSCNKRFNVDVDITFAVTKPYCHTIELVHQLRGSQMFSRPEKRIYCCEECNYFVGEDNLEKLKNS